MKDLNFRFQRIFDLKDRLEETRRLALGAAVSEWERQRQALSLLQRSLIEHGTNSNSQRGDALHATLLRSGHDYAMRLERDILTQMKTVHEAESIVEERRHELQMATKERRVFEILRERAVEAHRYEQRRQERIWLDEVGQRIHARRVASEGTESREGLGNN